MIWRAIWFKALADTPYLSSIPLTRAAAQSKRAEAKDRDSIRNDWAEHTHSSLDGKETGTPK